ncbi:hypothetical protein O9993_20390 [Vibrio lentus]|nr:hypothetical protein [Vibrio lentus]
MIQRPIFPRTVAKSSTYQAFRSKGENFYQEFYGFEHHHEQWLDKAAWPFS